GYRLVAGGAFGDVAGDGAENARRTLHSLVTDHDRRRVQPCCFVAQSAGDVAHHHRGRDGHAQHHITGHRLQVIFGDAHGVDDPNLRAAAVHLATVVALHRGDDVQRSIELGGHLGRSHCGHSCCCASVHSNDDLVHTASLGSASS